MEPTEMHETPTQRGTIHPLGEIRFPGFPSGEFMAAVPKKLKDRGQRGVPACTMINVKLNDSMVSYQLMSWLGNSTAVVVQSGSNDPEVLWNFGEEWDNRPLKKRVEEKLFKKTICHDFLELFESIPQQPTMMNIYLNMEKKGKTDNGGSRYHNLLIVHVNVNQQDCSISFTTNNQYFFGTEDWKAFQ
jgi:hypothetical protein